MAHRLLPQEPQQEEKTQKRFKISFPPLTGKFGFSFFTGKKEIFVGVSIGEVEIERIIRQRRVVRPKAGIKVYRFDSL